MAQFTFPVGDRHIEDGIHRLDRAEFPAAHDLQHAQEGRMEPVVKRFDQGLSGAVRGVHHPGCLGGVHGEGLFAQDCLAGFQCGNGQIGMPVRGQGIVDQVHIRAAHQRLIIGLDMGYAVRVGIGARFRFVARGNGDNLAVAAGCGWVDYGLGADLGCAENADADHEGSLSRGLGGEDIG